MRGACHQTLSRGNLKSLGFSEIAQSIQDEVVPGGTVSPASLLHDHRQQITGPRLRQRSRHDHFGPVQQV